MKLKLDENVDLRIISDLRLAGHDIATVQGQGLSSASDIEVINVCHHEGRCLVTADRGFGNRFRYNPANYSGIIVIRLSYHSTLANWRQAIEIVIRGLESAKVEGKLWIIQHGKILEYQSIEGDETI